MHFQIVHLVQGINWSKFGNTVEEKKHTLKKDMKTYKMLAKVLMDAAGRR